MNVFDSQFNLPAINLIVDKLPSAKTTDPTGNWEDEESVDVEWAHAIAPAASIVVINCGTKTADFLNAVNVAANYPSGQCHAGTRWPDSSRHGTVGLRRWRRKAA